MRDLRSICFLFFIYSCVGFDSGVPAITWLSQPVQPGETLLLSGANLDSSCIANFSTTSTGVARTWALGSVVPGHATASSLKIPVPAALPADVYTLVLACDSGEAPPVLVNAASPWWAQGDGGDVATPGGWLRVSGLNVAWLSSEALSARAEERAALRALRGGASGPALEAAVAALASARGARGLAEPSTVRLTPLAGGAPVDLTPIAANATQFSVWVSVPTDLTPGEYSLSVSNGRGPGVGGAFASLDSYYDPATPHVRTVVIAVPAAWPAGVFPVTRVTAPAAWPFAANATSDADVAAALAAARAAGGGTVAFAAGTFFLTAPLVVPPGVALAGAGANATVLVFSEATPASAPAAYISLDDEAAASTPSGTAAWAVRDLAVVITGFHYHVFAVSNFTDGWALERVTMRANAFFAQNNAGTFGPAAPPGVQTVTHGRSANWTLQSPGNGVQLNARNFRIVNCDLWTTYNAITSFASNGKAGCNGKTWPNSCHGATFGWIADNAIHHGGASHFMNQWRQVIYERNVAVGASVTAMGNSVGTGPDGGHDHHILHVDNEVRSVWGNDRELMTFDDAGGAYFGRVASVAGATTTTAADCKPPGDMTAGGWAGSVMVVLNGTGAGQWRRVVVPGIDGANKTDARNRTWVLEAPWDVAPDETSWVQIAPFRGRSIFAGDVWADGGAVQYYGQALDCVLADAVGERMTGFLAWGQWRGWTPANASEMVGGRAAAAAAGATDLLLPPPPPLPQLRGQMGNGIMPNLRNQYLRNTIASAWASPNYNYSVGYDAAYGRRFFAVQPLGNAPANISATFLLVYRHNNGGGGYNFGAGAADVLVDGGAFVLDAGQAAQGSCVLIGEQTRGILTTGVQCSVL